jgi:hypothetical protein
MTDEKNLVEVTIRVDMSAGVTLDHVCARCGATARSTPSAFDSFNRHTGEVNEIFTVRNAADPAGWEHVRIQYAEGEGAKHVEVCPECLRAFFRFIEAK